MCMFVRTHVCMVYNSLHRCGYTTTKCVASNQALCMLFAAPCVCRLCYAVLFLLTASTDSEVPEQNLPGDEEEANVGGPQPEGCDTKRTLWLHQPSNTGVEGRYAASHTP